MTPTDLDYLRTVAAKARLEAATNPEHGDAEFLEVLDAAVEAGEYRLNGWSTVDRLFAAVLAWVRAIEAETEQWPQPDWVEPHLVNVMDWDNPEDAVYDEPSQP